MPFQLSQDQKDKFQKVQTILKSRDSLEVDEYAALIRTLEANSDLNKYYAASAFAYTEIGADFNFDNKRDQHFLGLAYHACTHDNVRELDAQDTHSFLRMACKAGVAKNSALDGVDRFNSGLSTMAFLGSYLLSPHAGFAMGAFATYLPLRSEARFEGITREKLETVNNALFNPDFVARLFKDTSLNFTPNGQQHLLGCTLDQQIVRQVNDLKPELNKLAEKKQDVSNLEFDQKLQGLQDAFVLAGLAGQYIFKNSKMAQIIPVVGVNAVTVIKALGQISSGAAQGFAMGGPYVAIATAVLSTIAVFKSQRHDPMLELQRGVQAISKQVYDMQKSMMKGFETVGAQVAHMNRDMDYQFNQLHIAVSLGFEALQDTVERGFHNLEESQLNIQKCLNVVIVSLNKLGKSVQELCFQHAAFAHYLNEKLDRHHDQAMAAYYLAEYQKTQRTIKEVQQKLAMPKIYLGQSEQTDADLFNALSRILSDDAYSGALVGDHFSAHVPNSIYDALKDQANTDPNARVSNAVSHIHFIFLASGYSGKAPNYNVWMQGVEALLLYLFLLNTGFGKNRQQLQFFCQQIQDIIVAAKTSQDSLKKLTERFPTLKDPYVNSIQALIEQTESAIKQQTQYEIEEARKAEIQKFTDRMHRIQRDDFSIEKQDSKLVELQKEYNKTKAEWDKEQKAVPALLAKRHRLESEIRDTNQDIAQKKEEAERLKAKNRECEDHHKHAKKPSAKKRRGKREEEIDELKDSVKKERGEIKGDQKKIKKTDKKIASKPLVKEMDHVGEKLEKEKQERLEKLKKKQERLQREDDFVLKRMKKANPSYLPEAIFGKLHADILNVAKNIYHAKANLINHYLLFSGVLSVCFPEAMIAGLFKEFLSDAAIIKGEEFLALCIKHKDKPQDIVAALKESQRKFEAFYQLVSDQYKSKKLAIGLEKVALLLKSLESVSATYSSQSSYQKGSGDAATKRQSSSETEGTGHGIDNALRERFGNDVHFLHPDMFSIHSPFDSEAKNAGEAAVIFAKAVRGYHNQDNSFADTGFIKQKDDGILKKPIIAIINTGRVRPTSATDTQAIGGIHWVALVILPKQYKTRAGRECNNAHERIFVLDSLNPQRDLPASFKKVLREGIKVGFCAPADGARKEAASWEHKVPAIFPDAQWVNLSTEGYRTQQQGGTDCAWWAVDNAIKIVEEGSVESIVRASQENEPHRATDLRRQYPNLAQEAPLQAERAGQKHTRPEGSSADDEPAAKRARTEGAQAAGAAAASPAPQAGNAASGLANNRHGFHYNPPPAAQAAVAASGSASMEVDSGRAAAAPASSGRRG